MFKFWINNLKNLDLKGIPPRRTTRMSATDSDNNQDIHFRVTMPHDWKAIITG